MSKLVLIKSGDLYLSSRDTKTYYWTREKRDAWVMGETLANTVLADMNRRTAESTIVDID